jgi:hypothetical protein
MREKGANKREDRCAEEQAEGKNQRSGDKIMDSIKDV